MSKRMGCKIQFTLPFVKNLCSRSPGLKEFLFQLGWLTSATGNPLIFLFCSKFFTAVFIILLIKSSSETLAVSFSIYFFVSVFSALLSIFLSSYTL
ncbi:hypothetical protein SAMN05216389_107154 [Oceanobacillus limi]|uniref:Uncharacterized protein n=1 Tax=Oceanobacillus limi TaxID=930131 RepID=A0A1I0D0P4_9BACI|nr:hypothetical protein SAMN05216389_107154 [Oceanobacillus limi]